MNSWYPIPKEIEETPDIDLMTFSQPLSFRDKKEAREWAWEYQQFWIAYFTQQKLPF